MADLNSPIIWQPSNVYPTVKFGNNVQVGAFCEVGHNVELGDNVHVGAFCFIPEGVVIKADAWIGPRVTFSNDMYPPSGKQNWQTTIVNAGARIGAAVNIRPGVTIGEGALIGMGAVVTQDVPAGEIWVGIPAKKLEGGNGDHRIQCSQEDKSEV